MAVFLLFFLKLAALDPLAKLNIEAASALKQMEEQIQTQIQDQAAQNQHKLPTTKLSLAQKKFKLKLPIAISSATIAIKAHRNRRIKRDLKTQIKQICTNLNLQTPNYVATASYTTLRDILRRLEFCRQHILPACKQLNMRPDVEICDKCLSELELLSASLQERVKACARFLDCFVRLDQTPPSDFRSWAPDELNDRAQTIELKEPLLRKVLSLQSQLGSKRMDWSLPDWSEESLESRIMELESQLKVHQAHKEKQKLLGQVEAAFWIRKMDPPIGLSGLGIEELKDKLRQLKVATPE